MPTDGQAQFADEVWVSVSGGTATVSPAARRNEMTTQNRPLGDGSLTQGLRRGPDLPRRVGGVVADFLEDLFFRFVER